MGSILPNHDAKSQNRIDRREPKKEKQRKPKGRLHQTWLEHKKIIEKNNLYDV